MGKSWSKQDASYLKRYAKDKTLAELAERYEREEAEVTKKLKELGLASKDGYGRKPRYEDPALGQFEKGIQAFHKSQWKTALKLFEQVVGEADQADLAASARAYVAVCEERTSSDNEVDDPYLEAVVAKNAGDLEIAAELCSRGGRRSKDERFAYLAASVSALEGKIEEALDLLQVSIELNPKNRVHAFHDPDFESLRGESEFAQLFEAV